MTGHKRRNLDGLGLSKKFAGAEKIAEEAIREFLKATEDFRTRQLKKVKAILKQAQATKHHELIDRAEEIKRLLERSALGGLDVLMAKLDLPSKGEIDRLQKRVCDLEKRLDELQASRTTKE